MNYSSAVSYNPSLALRSQQPGGSRIPQSLASRTSTIQSTEQSHLNSNSNNTNSNSNSNSNSNGNNQLYSQSISRNTYQTNPTSSFINEMNTPQNRAKRRSTLLSASASTNRKRQSFGLQQPPSQQQAIPNSQLQQLQAQSSNRNMFASQTTPLSSQQQLLQIPIPLLLQQVSSRIAAPHILDPRPLRDRGFQEQMQRHINNFLVSHDFERKSRVTFSENLLKFPTQSNFNEIFKFICFTIDSSFRFEKTPEQEIFLTLRALDYPYLGNITKTQIGAVGGHNWPTFLGILDWLVEVSELNSCAIDDYDPTDEFDKIFLQYSYECYEKYFTEDENYDEQYEDLERGFNLEIENCDKLLNSGEERIRALQETADQKLVELKLKNDADRKTAALEDDHEKLKEYIVQVKKMIPDWKTKIEMASNEIHLMTERLKQLDKAKKDLHTELQQRGLHIDQIDRLHIERDSYTKAVEAAHLKGEELKDQLANRIFELETNVQDFETVLLEYNQGVQRLNYDEISGFQFGLRLNHAVKEEGLTNSAEAFGRDEILENKSINDERVQLIGFIDMLKKQIVDMTKESQATDDKINSILEMINQQRDEVDDLQIQDSLSKRKCDDIAQNLYRQQTDFTSQIEETEQRVREIKMSMTSSLLDLEKRLRNANIAKNSAIGDIQLRRREMSEQIEKITSYVLKFKTNVQERLMIMADSIQKKDYE